MRLGAAAGSSMRASSNIDQSFTAEIPSKQLETDLITRRRPHNSYLKILMNNSVFEDLHFLTHQLKSKWEDVGNENQCLDVGHQALSRVISDAAFQPFMNKQPQLSQESKDLHKTNPRPNLKIKTRSLQSLHMTYFFCGTMLNEMPKDQLVLLNHMFRERLTHVDNKDGAYWLRFKSIDLFPPQRQNLIAAKFESSPALDQLFEELCDVAMTPKSVTGKSDEEAEDVDKHPFELIGNRKYQFPLLRSNVFKQVKKRRQQQKHNDNTTSPWVAHVTLANIVGGKNSGIKQLGQWLNDQQLKPEACLSHREDIAVKGLSLGGPYPEHVDLDWDFPFDL
jgi:2'-5' RNA ligase